MSDELREQIAQALAEAAPFLMTEAASWERLPQAQRDEYHRLADAALAVIGPALDEARRDGERYLDVMQALQYPDRELRAVVGSYAIIATRDSKGCNEVGRSTLRYAAKMLAQRLGGYDQDEAVAVALEAMTGDAAVKAAAMEFLDLDYGWASPDPDEMLAMREALTAAVQAVQQEREG